MPFINLLAIFNSSNYWRCGHITTPWQPIHQKFQIPSDQLILSDLRDLTHTPFRAQIAQVDPEDPSRDVLTFFLSQKVAPSAEDGTLASGFVKLDQGKPIPTELGEPTVEVVYGSTGEARGVRLTNSRLIVWFNLIPAPEDNEKNWFSGSATSIQLDHQEILDPLRAAKGEWLGQDPEKRCLQITELLLPGPSHPKSPFYHVPLFNHSYRLVSQTSGPARASITIASEPFDYMGADPDIDANRHLICEFYRVISLYAGADYLVEELFIKGKPKGEEDKVGKDVVNLSFTPRYFAYMNMGLTADIQQIFPTTNWFAVGSTVFPYPAYGMATDVHIDSLSHPYEGNPNCFSWQLLPGKSVKCVHMFMRGQPEEFDTRMGHYWYELIYQPLKAQIYSETVLTETQKASSVAFSSANKVSK